MLNRSKIRRRHRIWVTALGVLLLLASLPLLWALMLPVNDPNERVPEWQLMLGRELSAQAQREALGSIQGVATLQGREVHLGVQVLLDDSATTATIKSGQYVFPEVSAGTHTIDFSHPGYLKMGIVVNVAPGQDAQASDVELLGGDVNGDGSVGVNDLRRIAQSALGIGDPATDDENDVNGDGKNNISDLVLAGGNFNKSDVGPSGIQFNLERAVAALRFGNNAQAEEAIDSGMTALYGGFRPVLSKGMGQDQTGQAHESISKMEMEFVEALRAFIDRGAFSRRDPNLTRKAFDLMIFVHQINSVAETVSNITSRCGLGDMVAHPSDTESGNIGSPCNQLIPLINDPVQNQSPFVAGESLEIGKFPEPFQLFPSYSVALKADIVPPRWSREVPELVTITEPIADGECDTVFKEIRGLMLLLHLDRIPVVADPWEDVFDVPKGSDVPVWSLEWQPAEYVKTWNMCNEGGEVKVALSSEVLREAPVNYFWRFYEAGQ